MSTRIVPKATAAVHHGWQRIAVETGGGRSPGWECKAQLMDLGTHSDATHTIFKEIKIHT